MCSFFLSFSKPSIFFSKFPFQTAARMNFGKIEDSYFSHALFLSNTVFHSKPSIVNFGCSILDSSFSHLLFLSQFSFQKPARLNFGWSILGSFFSHPMFLSMLLFKNLQFQLWMVRSCIPTFLMPSSS